MVTVKVLYGNSMEELNYTPRRESDRWYTLKTDLRSLSDDKIAVLLYKLNGPGYYDIRTFRGFSQIERYLIFRIFRRQNRYVDYQVVF